MTGTRSPHRRLLSLLAATALAPAALAGCASSGGATSAGPTSAAGSGSSAVITIKDFEFSTPSSVRPGATITVDNRDPIAHTVTADSGNAFDDQAPTGRSTFRAPTKPGSYPFHCTPHPEMHGTLVVK